MAGGGGVSETQLARLSGELGLGGFFLGTFDRRFPGFEGRLIRSKGRCGAIVNTSFREEGGQHWIAMGWDPKERKLHLFDPLGWRDEELKRYYGGFSYERAIRGTALRADGRADGCVTVVRNRSAVQCTCSGACGLYCLLFLYAFRHRPGDPDGFPAMREMEGRDGGMKPSDPTALHRNQERLYAFLRRSPSFRAQENAYRRDTGLGLIKTHA